MEKSQAPKIKPRERDAVLQSLQAGLVPKLGLHLIQVGRKLEVSALLQDIDRINGGGAAFRFVIGRFGSGKSFFLTLSRNLALQKRLVVLSADISMERRLQASGGQARGLYSELMRNLSTRARPEGGALRSICEGWISNIHHEVMSAGGSEDEVVERIRNDLNDLSDYVGGYAFSHVLAKYYEGHIAGDDALQNAALRWLRGEYSTKTEARQDLGVREIIEDENIYGMLKLIAAFTRKAGYGGILVSLDEMVVLSHRLPSSRSRHANYEALLTILNDCLQGGASGIGFLLAGTDEFLEDKRRGLFSYEALRSRLADNPFTSAGVQDLAGPVIRLPNLTAEDLYVLLVNINRVHGFGDSSKALLQGDAIEAVLRKANETLGAEYFKTPRDIIRSFVGLLNVLEQNPEQRWEELVGADFIRKPTVPMSVEEEVAQGGMSDDDQDSDLASFKL
ncbi:ATP-binding protein [Coraliomargarita parva]|uniref:ATP-binding protein n=1 Tax=Coraliomargarita parva TaxID=3014050 RepID=UPI0022B37AA6|nr:ATP-binding protein [Coraliomargarita parva]